MTLESHGGHPGVDSQGDSLWYQRALTVMGLLTRSSKKHKIDHLFDPVFLLMKVAAQGTVSKGGRSVREVSCIKINVC